MKSLTLVISAALLPVAAPAQAHEAHELSADPDGDPSTDDRPQLFGQPFDGPVSGPGDAPIYLLHAWVHKRNPSGMFAPFIPPREVLTCDSGRRT
jgi:hypothetical protein